MNPLFRTTVITVIALGLALAGLVAFLPTPAGAPTGDGRQTTGANPKPDEMAAAARRVIDNVRWFDGERLRPPAAITLADGRIASIDAPGVGRTMPSAWTPRA